MKNICFINGSPKGKKSNSLFFLNRLDEDMNENNYNKFYIHVTSSIHSGKIEEDFKTMSYADAIVIAFPLYVFCLPGVLISINNPKHVFHSKVRKSTLKGCFFSVTIICNL